jgi:uncharacterized protein YneF (UPF0154 family)
LIGLVLGLFGWNARVIIQKQLARNPNINPQSKNNVRGHIIFVGVYVGSS